MTDFRPILDGFWIAIALFVAAVIVATLGNLLFKRIL